MPKKTESTLHFTIGRSRLLRLMIDCLHALSVSACWLNDLPISYKLIVTLLVAASWLFQRNACEASRIFLRYTVVEGWTVSFDGEHYLVVKIKPTTVTGSMLTVLNVGIEKRTRALVIFKDAMTANDYRQLIVNLKISGYGQE